MLVLILFCEEITVMVLNKARCVDFCTLLLVYQFMYSQVIFSLFIHRKITKSKIISMQNLYNTQTSNLKESCLF